MAEGVPRHGKLSASLHGYETLTVLLHESRREVGLLQERLARAHVELRAAQSRLGRYEPCRLTLGPAAGDADDCGGDGGGSGRWPEGTLVFSRGRPLLESLAMEVARLRSRLGAGEATARERWDSGGGGREPGLSEDELYDVILVLEQSLSGKEAERAGTLKERDGEGPLSGGDSLGGGARDPGELVTHELRVRLAAATEMSRQLSRRLLQQDGPGSIGLTKKGLYMNEQMGEESSGGVDQQQKAVQRVAQLEEENETLRNEMSHEKEENVRWRHYEASLQECIHNLQSQVMQLQGQFSNGDGAEHGTAVTSRDPAGHAAAAAAAAEPTQGMGCSAAACSQHAPGRARAVPVEALDSSQQQNLSEARPVCYGDVLQQHCDTQELNALREKVASLQGMLEEVLSGQDMEELASLRAFVRSQEKKITGLQAELYRKDTAYRDLHTTLRQLEVERADEHKSSKDYKENIDLLKQQMIIYQEDFRSERKDRERAQAMIQQLQRENVKLHKQILSLERMIPRAMVGGGPHRTDGLHLDVEPAERVAGQASPEGPTAKPRDEAPGWQRSQKY